MRWQPWISHERENYVMRRRARRLGAQRLCIEQCFEGTHPSAVIATGPDWFVSEVRVVQGALHFECGPRRLVAPPRFLLFAPPWSLVRMPFVDARVETCGIAGLAVPRGWPGHPVMTTRSGTDTNFQALDSTLREAPVEEVGADLGCAPRLVAQRLELARSALRPRPIGRLLQRHAMHPSVFSRRFRGAYGITARAYCQRIRIHRAVAALFLGQPIAHVALDAGFPDLSRFYRQFRRHTGHTPGRYRGIEVKKRQDGR